MREKESYITLFVIVLGSISLYLFSILDIQLQEFAQKVLVQKYNLHRTLEVLILIVFGIIIEYKKLISIFKNGVVLNKYLLIATIALIVLLVLPYDITARLGIQYPSSIRGTASFLINSINTRSILSVLAGILLTRSLTDSRWIEDILKNLK